MKDSKRETGGDKNKPLEQEVSLQADTMSWPERLAVAGLLAALALQCLFAMPMLAPTFDEFGHLPAGYTYLERGNFEFYKHNPPLLQMVMALPLLAMNPELPPEKETLDYTRWEYARAFHELNADDFDSLFYYARLPTVFFSIVLAYVVFRWCRRWHGKAGGFLGLSLLCFNPFYIAHSQLATVDVGASLAATLMFFVLARYLENRRLSTFAAFAILFGLCQAAKFSSLLLFAVVPLILLVALILPWITDSNGMRRKNPKRPPWQAEGLVPWLFQCLLLGAASCVVICASFGFDRLFTHFGDFDFVSEQMNALQKVDLLEDVPVPLPYYYMEGLDAQNDLNHRGFSVYLLGERSQEGFKSYFAVAFLSKMTLGFLVLLALSIPFWVVSFFRHRDFRWLFLLIPVAVYSFYFSFMITVQCGLRYLLPVIPLVVVFIAIAGSRLWKRGAAGKAAILLPVIFNVFNCALIYPDYIPFFNEAWGGPSNGHKVIVATDFDWGQDLKRFKEYTVEHPLDDVQTDLFGKMDPLTYGIENARDMEKFPSTGSIIISVQNVINSFVPTPDRSWLMQYEPVLKFGYTLHLYHITAEDLERVYTGDQIEAFGIANQADGLTRSDPVRAEEMMKEAVRLYPDCWQIHHFMAQFYFSRKRHQECRRSAKKACELNPDHQVYIELEKNERAE